MLAASATFCTKFCIEFLHQSYVLYNRGSYFKYTGEGLRVRVCRSFGFVAGSNPVTLQPLPCPELRPMSA